MTLDTLKHANEISDYLCAIVRLGNFIRFPYPEIWNNDEGFNTASLDPQTLKELKEAWEEVLNRRAEELRAELEQL